MSSLNRKIISYTSSILFSIFKRKRSIEKIYPKSYSKILILQVGTIQEALNITPFLKVMKENFDSSFSVLTVSINTEIYKNNKYIDYVFTYSEVIKYILHNIIHLRKINFDIIIDVSEEDDFVSSLHLAMIKSQYKVGFDKNKFNLLTHRVDTADHKRIHIVDRILNLTDAFEIDYSKSDLNIVYQPSPEAQKSIEDYIIKHDLSYKLTVIINISSELGIGSWGTDNFKSLIKYLKNYDINIVIAASLDDIKNADKIADGKYLVYYITDVDQYAQLLNSSGFIFSPDSFTIQLAAAFKVPVFCLFVQHESEEMINVPYNSDFDFSLTDKESLKDISYGKVLNSFVPYFEYVFERYNPSESK